MATTQARRRVTPLLVVIETKLWPPLVREGALPRTQLVEALQESISRHAVTLLSAGAGFGKTSLLAAWYASRPVPETVAWVRLDAADNDPVRFWAHVAEALWRTYRSRLESASEPLEPSPSGMVATLANELAAIRAPRVLVLDDFHLVTDLGVAEGLDALVAALPPKARVVIATRADPPISLARLRAAGQLGELRARELAYTFAEARELVERTLLPGVGDRDAERLRRRTEGWPAGMYLALLAAADSSDAHAFVARFAGDTHTIADYLGGEVLAHLDAETRSFLVHSSVLEELTGPLCDAALATTGSAARLCELERSNLFLIPLDDRREWFRYHALFRDLLRLEFARLDAETRSAVHRRASTWYAGTGGRPALAIEHALAAEDWPAATKLVLATAFDAVRKGRWVTVLGWISALPAEELVAHPILPAFAVVIVTSLRAEPRELERWLACCDESRRRFPDRWTPEADVCVAYPRAVLVGTDVGAAVQAAERLVEAGAGTGLHAQTIAYGLLAWNRHLAGDLDGAAAAAAEALADEDAPGWATGRMHAYAVLSQLAYERGDAEGSLRLAHQAAAAAREFDVLGTAIAGRAHVALALASVLAGKLDQAEADATVAVGADGRAARDASRVAALILLASIRRRRRRFAQAREALDEAERAMRGFVDPGRLPEMLELARTQLEKEEADARGTEQLTDAELPVLRLLATDLTLREIAASLFLSQNTVKTHSRSIYRKLHVGSRADAVAQGRDLGLLDDSPG